tara:strand:- start:5765 stop:6028 length:264 start_codon:yes stop_codon:yes gene_type:complete
MNYTFRHLLEALQNLSKEELDQTAIVYVGLEDAFYPINYTDQTGRFNGDDCPHIIINHDDHENCDDVIAPTSEFSTQWLEHKQGSKK